MKAFITIALTAVLLLAAWQVFKPAPGDTQLPPANQPAATLPNAQTDTSNEPQATAPESPQPAMPAIVEARIELRDGRLAEGPEAVRVVQGQTVELTVLSDRNDELHLHGYDITLQLQANKPATLAVEATRSGRFEYEIHSSHSGVGALEVYPAQQ